MDAKEFFSTYRGNFNANMLRLLCNNYEIDYKTNIQIPQEEDLKTTEKFKNIIPFEKITLQYLQHLSKRLMIGI